MTAASSRLRALVRGRRPARWARATQERLQAAAEKLRYGGTRRHCLVCGRTVRRFAPFGVVRRTDARCIHCGALERHRFAWLFLKQRTDLFDGRTKRVLHIAPEPCLEGPLRERLGRGYLSADIERSRALLVMDIERMPYPDACLDVVLCSHVLEHVADDRRGMREILRVLKPDGWALLLVPITAAATIEDPSVTSPEERLARFGQVDHVRRYGPDFVDRLRQAGFAVDVIHVADMCDEGQRDTFGLPPSSGELFLCRRSATAPGAARA